MMMRPPKVAFVVGWLVGWLIGCWLAVVWLFVGALTGSVVQGVSRFHAFGAERPHHLTEKKHNNFFGNTILNNDHSLYEN